MSESHGQPAANSNSSETGPKLSDGLKRFMVGLASDVGKLTAFMLDQNKAFDEAGLTTEQRELLLSGDQSRIYAALKDLPLPPPNPNAPSMQMPMVVAAMNMGQGAATAAASPSGNGAAAAAAQVAPAAQLPPYYVVQQPSQHHVQQMSMQVVPTYQYPQHHPQHLQPGQHPQQAYYLVPWPVWPTAR